MASVETRRRRFSTRDGDVRREATGGAVTRHRQDVVHASVLAQTREYPRERREATVLDVQIRANSSGVVRRRAVAVRRSRGDGVVRQTQTSRDAPTMSRRVANARRRGNSRREQRRKGFQTPRDTSRARVRLRLARGGVRARAGARARVADAKATRRVLGVVRFQTLSRATSAWAEEAAEARRRRVAVRRCVSRRDRRATARAFDAWARARARRGGSDGDGGSDVSSRDVAAVATGVVLRVAASRGRARRGVGARGTRSRGTRRDSKGDSSVVRVHRRGSGIARGGDETSRAARSRRRGDGARRVSMQRPTLALAHRRDRRCAKPPRVRGAFERVRGVGEARARHVDVARAPRRDAKTPRRASDCRRVVPTRHDAQTRAYPRQTTTRGDARVQEGWRVASRGANHGGVVRDDGRRRAGSVRRPDDATLARRASRRETMARTRPRRARVPRRVPPRRRENNRRAPRATLFRVARLQRGRRLQPRRNRPRGEKNASPRPKTRVSRVGRRRRRRRARRGRHRPRRATRRSSSSLARSSWVRGVAFVRERRGVRSARCARRREWPSPSHDVESPRSRRGVSARGGARGS